MAAHGLQKFLSKQELARSITMPTETCRCLHCWICLSQIWPPLLQATSLLWYVHTRITLEQCRMLSTILCTSCKYPQLMPTTKCCNFGWPHLKKREILLCNLQDLRSMPTLGMNYDGLSCSFLTRKQIGDVGHAQYCCWILECTSDRERRLHSSAC